MADSNILLPVTFGEPGIEGPPGPPGPPGSGGGGGATIPDTGGLPTIIGSDGTNLVATTNANDIVGSDIALAYQTSSFTFGQGIISSGTLLYYDGTNLTGFLPNTGVFLSTVSGALEVQAITGDDASGELKSLHNTYNFGNGSGTLSSNIGRAGYAKTATLTQAAGAVTEYFDWPDESGATLDVRCLFVRNAARLRRSRTYDVSKVAGTLTVTAKAGGPIDEFTAIAGCDIVLFAGTGGNAGKLGLTTTPASAAGTTTQVSKSIDGDLLMRPAT